MATYTFYSPVDTNETIDIITKVVKEIGGKASVSGNVIIAKWRSRKFHTVFPSKFTFYVGKDMVRVVNGSSECNLIVWQSKYAGFSNVWNDFVKTLLQVYPNMDFHLESGDYRIVSAKIMSDGIEQTFSSSSVTSPSIARALIGGALFGGVGAIVGGSRSTTVTSGSTNAVFSKDVLVAVRYSNGLNSEGKISKYSSVYNQILANLSELSED